MTPEARGLFPGAVRDGHLPGTHGFPSIERMHRPAPRPLHILVVEDNTINQRVAERILDKLGHTWVTVSNGREALQAVDSEDFDVVLMDIQMPEMDGLEATRRIREQERNNGGHLPIIALTANVLDGDREQFLEGGMDGYVPKPVRVSQLLEAIDDVLCAGSAPLARGPHAAPGGPLS
ncbi:MAG: response regulator [Acidobacteriia bacterium]|nr:response regulator [Terriglobia bacterium]